MEVDYWGRGISGGGLLGGGDCMPQLRSPSYTNKVL